MKKGSKESLEFLNHLRGRANACIAMATVLEEWDGKRLNVGVVSSICDLFGYVATYKRSKGYVILNVWDGDYTIPEKDKLEFMFPPGVYDHQRFLLSLNNFQKSTWRGIAKQKKHMGIK